MAFVIVAVSDVDGDIAALWHSTATLKSTPTVTYPRVFSSCHATQITGVEVSQRSLLRLGASVSIDATVLMLDSDNDTTAS